MAVTLNTTTGNTQVLERNDFAVTSMICNAGGFLEPTIRKGTSLSGNGSTANPLVVKLSTDAGNDIVFGTDGGVKLDVSVLNNTITGIWQFQNPVAFGTSTPADRPIVVDTAGNTLTAGASSVLVQGSANKERLEARSVFNGGAIFQVSGSRGTIAAPLYSQINDQLGFFQFRSYNESTVQYVALTQMTVIANEAHTASNGGTEWQLLTSTKGTYVPTTRIKASDAGILNQVGAATTFAQDGGTVFSSSNLAENTAGGADTTTDTYSLPANAFVKTADRIDIKYQGFFAATANAGKRIRILFGAGAATIADFTQGATGVVLPITINASVTRYGPGAATALLRSVVTVGATVSSQRNLLAGVSWTGANNIVVIANGTGLGDVTRDSVSVDYYRAP